MVLQTIRERLTGVLAFVILGILVIPFAFVGVNEYFSSGNANQVALVNDVEITFNDFNQSFLNYRRSMQSRLGEAFDPNDYDNLVARLEHLDRLIDEELLRQTAVGLEFEVDDERLAQQIREFPAFQVEGQFNSDVYQSRILSQGLTIPQFEEQLRQSTVVSTLPAGIRTSSFATDSEYKEYAALQEQTRSFQVVAVPSDIEAVGDDFSEDEVLTWFDANQSQYQTEETVVIEYLEITLENVDTGEEPNEDELRELYEEQKGRFISPEQRRVSHILIEAAGDADAAMIEAARLEAEALAERVRAGEDFATLASENSDDIGSAGLGGDLGFLEPGVMVESFEQAAYELNLESPVSDPVQTGFGWHVILLAEIRESSGMAFEEAKVQLIEEAREEQGERAFLELADRMVDVVYEDPTTLEAASLDLGIDIQTEGPFTRSGGFGVSGDPDVVAAAYSDLVLLQSSVSDPIDLGPNHIVMLRVLEHAPVRAQTLEEVRDEVIAGMREDRANEAAEDRANGLLAAIENGETLETVAEAEALIPVIVDAAARSSAVPDPVTVTGVFKLARPDEGGVSRGVVPSLDGFSVVEITLVTDGSIDESALLGSRQARLLMGSVAASYESWALVRQLREESDVKIFEDNLGVSR